MDRWEIRRNNGQIGVAGMDKREELANLCHEQWSGWMKYLFSKCHRLPLGRGMYIPGWAFERWKRQMDTPYTALSNSEQESDRREADKFIKLMNK